VFNLMMMLESGLLWTEFLSWIRKR